MPQSKLVNLKAFRFQKFNKPFTTFTCLQSVENKMGGYEMHVLHRSCRFFFYGESWWHTVLELFLLMGNCSFLNLVFYQIYILFQSLTTKYANFPSRVFVSYWSQFSIIEKTREFQDKTFIITLFLIQNSKNVLT